MFKENKATRVRVKATDAPCEKKKARPIEVKYKVKKNGEKNHPVEATR